jgi:diguanylate cyclase (GGDEF)-like protein
MGRGPTIQAVRTQPRSASRLFGLAEAEHPSLLALQAQQLAQMGVVLPFAVAAQLLGALGLAALLLHSGEPLTADVVVACLLLSLSGIGTLGLTRLKSFRALPLHHQARASVFCGALLGVGATLLLIAASGGLSGAAKGAALVIGGGAAAVSALALQPLRGALLAFAGAMAAATLTLAGFGLAANAAGLFLLCVCGAAFRLARHDLGEAAARARNDAAAALATRLVREYEGSGTGWFWETDRHGRLTYLSQKVVAEFGGPEAVTDRPLTELFEIDGDARETERTLSFHLSARTSFSEYSVRAAGGAKDRWWSVSGRPRFDKLGRFRGFIGTGSDLTAKRQSEAEINRLARYDGLTGLANRERMRLALDQSLAHPGGGGGYRPTALMLLDLDRFKAVNDTLGHQIGDELLKQVAQRLRRCVAEPGLVGRLGGDEFKIVLTGEGNRERLGTLADTIIGALSQPYGINGTTILIGCSIGIAIAPDDGDTSETLVRNADLALYAAKADGRGVHRFYREEMLAEAQSRKALEDDLRRAVTQGQFHLVYQPVVCTESTEIVGYEALIRWEHPTRGAVSPAQFIPIAEDCGLIEQIGEWVLRTACAEAATWPGEVRVGVNVSPIQFANPALPTVVMSALSNSGLPPERLELEITEGVFLHESASTDQMFSRLKAIGVRLALDDFGTGYSSLGYLRTAPFDKIKIDQSFVRGAAIEGSRNAAIIRAIVTLATTLGMETTAEGAEIQDEITLIRELGCSHIQGYVYGRPMEAEAVRAQLGEGDGKAAASGHRFSRAPRTRMLRSAMLDHGGRHMPVRIRSMSASGAMIDGVARRLEIGSDVRIELLERQMFRAQVRWSNDGKAGLEFAEPFDMERLNAPAPTRSLLRSA